MQLAVKGIMAIGNGVIDMIIPGTNPGNKYKVLFANEKGVVGVKRDSRFGSDSETRVRCITLKVLDANNTSVGDDYDFLTKKKWESKPCNHHVSIQINESGAARESVIAKRVKEATEFICQ